jgi:hypothetical protein
MARTTGSMLPENSQSGRWRAWVFEARNHQAKPILVTIVGTTMASMKTSESTIGVRFATPIGPFGSVTLPAHPATMAADTSQAIALQPETGARPDTLPTALEYPPRPSARGGCDAPDRIADVACNRHALSLSCTRPTAAPYNCDGSDE